MWLQGIESEAVIIVVAFIVLCILAAIIVLAVERIGNWFDA